MPDENPVRTETPGAAPVTNGNPAAQVESLDDLAKEGAQLHQAGPTGAPAAPGAPAAVVEQVPKLADIVEMLEAVRDMAAPAAAEAGVMTEEQVRAIWTKERLERIAAPLLSIMRRHNLNNIEAAFDKWGPYAMLIAGLAVPGFATWRALQAGQAKPVSDAAGQ